MKKSLAILGQLLVAAIPTSAQTCTATVSNYNDTDKFSGSAVVPNSYTITGMGSGLVAVHSFYNSGIVGEAGDGTYTVTLSSISGAGSDVQSGLFVKFQAAGYPWFAFVYFDLTSSSVVFREVPCRIECGGTIIGSQSVSGAPLTLRIVKNGAVFTGYFSTDGVNFTSLNSWTAPINPATYTAGLLASSGDLTNLTAAEYTNVSFLGSYPTLVDHSQGGGGQLVAAVFQAGQLYIGQDTITGTVTLSSGCTGGGNHPFSLVPSNNLSLVVNPNTNPVTVLSSGNVTNPTIPCDSSCSFSITNPYPGNTPWGPATLVHGSPYNFTSTTYLSIRNSVEQLVIDLNPVAQTFPLNP